MDDITYDIYFTGQIVDGYLEGAVKKNLAKLFNASPEKINAMFAGKPVLLKKGLNKESAQKFAALMKKAGAKAVAKSHGGPEKPAQDVDANSASPNTAPNQTDDSGLSVAARGSDVINPNEYHHAEAVTVDISGLSAEGNFAPLEDNSPPPPPAPDTSHLSTAQVGSVLDESEAIMAVDIPDLDGLNITAMEGELLKEHEKPKVTPVTVDTSSFSVAAPGSDMGQKPDDPPPPAPDTSHLSIDK
jgi:hypothetical protein